MSGADREPQQKNIHLIDLLIELSLVTVAVFQGKVETRKADSKGRLERQKRNTHGRVEDDVTESLYYHRCSIVSGVMLEARTICGEAAE